MTDQSSATDEDTAQRQPTPGVDFVVSIQDIEAADINTALSQLQSLDCFDFHRCFNEARENAVQAGDDASSHAYALFSGLSYYHFVEDSRTEPFRPMMIDGDRRTLIPSDLLPEQIEVLARIAGQIENPGLRARAADVAWQQNRANSECGRLAVRSYCACATSVRDGAAQFRNGAGNPVCDQITSVLTRASIIARGMGWDRPEFNELRELIDELTQVAIDAEDPDGFRRIAELNFRNGIWPRIELAEAAERMANLDALQEDFFGKKPLWEIAARGYRAGNDEENANRCLIAAAECLVGNADQRPESAMVQSSFLNDAIQALRPIPGTADRRRELQQRLQSIQPNVSDEMSSFSQEQDISEFVERSRSVVRGLSLPKAILACLLSSKSSDPEEQRRIALEGAQNSISAFMVTTVCDRQGRTVFVAPGLSPDGNFDEDQVKYLISQNESFRRQAAVAGKISPMRNVITAEHPLSIDVFMPIMQASAFVPPGHEYIFSKGAICFFGGDDLEAAHLLLPQLENSLRHILSLSGVDSTRMNQDGTQEEAMLSRLLSEYREPLRSIVPEPLLNEIDLLFNFRGGPSVRHELAHGKMPAGEFWSSDVVYSSWLILHIATLPVLRMWDQIEREIARLTGLELPSMD